MTHMGHKLEYVQHISTIDTWGRYVARVRTLERLLNIFSCAVPTQCNTPTVLVLVLVLAHSNLLSSTYRTSLLFLDLLHLTSTSTPPLQFKGKQTA